MITGELRNKVHDIGDFSEHMPETPKKSRVKNSKDENQ